MKKNKKEPKRKQKEKVREAQHWKAVLHSEVLGDLNEEDLGASKCPYHAAKEPYQKYNQIEEQLGGSKLGGSIKDPDRFEIFLAVSQALVSKWPTSYEDDVGELARAAVNITDVLLVEYRK